MWLLVGLSAGLFLAAADLGVLKLLTQLIQGWESDADLISLLALLLGLGFLRALGQFMVRHSATAASEIIGADLRIRGLSLLLDAESSQKFSAADLHHELNEVFPKTALYFRQLVTCLGIGLHLLVLVFLLFWIQHRVALVGLSVLLVVFAFVLWLHKRTARLAVTIPDAHKELSVGVDRVARNWMLIRILRLGSSEHRDLKTKIESYSTKARAASIAVHLASALPVVLGLMTLCLCLYLGLSRWGASPATMVAFAYIFIRFVQATSHLSSSLGAAVALKPNVALAKARLKRVAATSPDSETSAEALQSETPPSIVISDLCFAHEGGPELFGGLNCTVKSGGTCVITGVSGSGKSTLIGLMSGILAPDQGRVAFRDLTAREYMSHREARVAYVSATPWLIEGTIRENLNYGSSRRRTDSELEDALSAVQLYDRLFAHGKGLDTQVSADGSPFSLGEQQRLCLARAFASHPLVLFLDEMTSSLDFRTQEAMVRLIQELPFNCTIVWATHRQDLAEVADVWVNLEKMPQKT